MSRRLVLALAAGVALVLVAVLLAPSRTARSTDGTPRTFASRSGYIVASS